jgi:methyl-accepting chemotaxis protein
VDFALQSLQERLSTMHPMEQGYVRLLSPGGTIIADRDPAKVGSKVDDAATKAMLAGTAKGQVVFGQSRDAALGEDVVETYVPLKIGNAGQNFAFGVVVPRSLLMQQARVLLWTIIGVGVAGVPAPGAGRERVRPDRRRQAGQCPARPAR